MKHKSPGVTGGLYVACVTPFDRNENVDLGVFRALIEHLIASGVDGVIASGTTGEAHALSLEERCDLYRTAVSQANGRVPVLAGTGATTSRQALDYLRLAADCGCDAALVLTPWFEKPSPDAIHNYYAELAESAPIPILLYHNPGRTHVDWPPEAVAETARKLAGPVIGYKDSTADLERVKVVRRLAPQDLVIFSGNPCRRRLFEGITDGSIDDITNALPRESVEAFHGDDAKAALLEQFLVLFARSRNYIALLKAIMAKVGLAVGTPRRPNDLVARDEIEEAERLLRVDGRLAGGGADAVGVHVAAPPRPMHLIPDDLLGKCLAARPVRSKTVAICPATPGAWTYACHASITHFRGRFFAAWSQGIINEDSPGQVVRWATSKDGLAWSRPRLMTPPPEGKLRWTNGGFWLRDGELWALPCRYTRARYVEGEGRPGLCWEDMATEAWRWDGRAWRRDRILIDDFYPNEAPRRLPDGHWMAPGVSGRHDAVVALGPPDGSGAWDVVIVSRRTAACRMSEPSWYAMPDGSIRMLLRDEAGSKRLFFTGSRDCGRSWSAPVPTDIPDAQAKFFALHLSDGRLALISNPAPDRIGRRLLAVATSADGVTFDSLRRLRFAPDAALRYAGLHKDAGFNYPNAVEVDGRLFIIYGTNKEDIELSIVALRNL